nr:MAG TPA: hypothetical protein [Caudoviricetes sp.]
MASADRLFSVLECPNVPPFLPKAVKGILRGVF